MNTPEDRETVLIVDDQPSNIQALGNLISGDYHILTATTGAKAIEIANSKPRPDLILLDVVMAGMDGYEVCHRLKTDENTNSIPVIFVTARDSTEDEEKGFRLGAVDYISKPFRPSIVRARVKNHMNLKLKTDMLEQLSMQDGLTDIPNRRFFEKSLDREWLRIRRNGQPLSLIMMDIDNFKPYNDNYGHGAGDSCLQLVAGALRSAMERPVDIAARYGGEEFVALLPETDAAGAMHVAEKLKRSVYALEISHKYSDTDSVVTVSFGIATHTLENPYESSEQLQQAADRALYMAKKKGRNRIEAV